MRCRDDLRGEVGHHLRRLAKIDSRPAREGAR
jgi:hypothetical protein